MGYRGTLEATSDAASPAADVGQQAAQVMVDEYLAYAEELFNSRNSPDGGRDRTFNAGGPGSAAAGAESEPAYVAFSALDMGRKYPDKDRRGQLVQPGEPPAGAPLETVEANTQQAGANGGLPGPGLHDQPDDAKDEPADLEETAAGHWPELHRTVKADGESGGTDADGSDQENVVARNILAASAAESVLGQGTRLGISLQEASQLLGLHVTGANLKEMVPQILSRMSELAADQSQPRAVRERMQEMLAASEGSAELKLEGADKPDAVFAPGTPQLTGRPFSPDSWLTTAATGQADLFFRSPVVPSPAARDYLRPVKVRSEDGRLPDYANNVAAWARGTSFANLDYLAANYERLRSLKAERGS